MAALSYDDRVPPRSTARRRFFSSQHGEAEPRSVSAERPGRYPPERLGRDLPDSIQIGHNRLGRPSFGASQSRRERAVNRAILKTSVAALFVLAGAQASVHAQPAPADIIFSNGKIITVDNRFSIAQAVAVRGDRIVA